MHNPSQPSFPTASGNLDKPPPLADLPPVEAPSASFVVQLFLIPAVVVAVVILVWLLFGKLAGGERDPAEYVRRLRQASGDWRSAFELASLIQNDAKLAADPHLLGELSDLLASELNRQTVDTRLTVYLIKTVGAFQTLDATLADGRKVDPIDPLARALEPKYDPAIRMEAAASLAKHAARMEGKLDDPKAVAALGEAASADDPELRQVAVYALGFFKTDAAVKLLRSRLQEDENRYVRYNTAIALGRRGDASAAGTLKEMLSTSQLESVVDLPTKAGQQNKIEAIELEALQAVRSSLSSGSSDLAHSLRPEVEALTRSGLVGVRTRAQELLQKLPPGN
ncbi:MAG: HEAT repeat domain-containing protein [Isosphaeraceae bacterium]